MKLRTWAGSYICTRERGLWIVIPWAAGWLRSLLRVSALKTFFVALLFIEWAFGWKAALAWYLICLYEKHNADDE